MEFRWPVGKKSMEDVALVLYPLATTQLVTGPLVSLNLLLLLAVAASSLPLLLPVATQPAGCLLLLLLLHVQLSVREG
jgi:hypothetical protein